MSDERKEKLDKNILGAIGEHYILAELLRNGIGAHLSHGKTQVGWDIIVFVNNEVKKIQVKTTELQNDSTNNSISIKKNGFDFIIFVILDSPNIYDYYVLTRDEIPYNNDTQVYLSEKNLEDNKYIVRNSFHQFYKALNKIKGSQ